MIVVDELRTYHPDQVKPWIRHRGLVWCHLMTEGDLEELHAFAQSLGLPRAAFQEHPRWPHYDLTPDTRALAVRLGAGEVKSLDWIGQRLDQMQAENGSSYPIPVREEGGGEREAQAEK